MYQQTVACTVCQCVPQIRPDLVAVVILEQLRICPLHPALAQYRGGRFPCPSQALQQKQRVRIFLLHASHYILPRLYGHLVPGITSEAVHPASAPGEEYLRHIVPQLHVVVLQFDKILPGRSPCAGARKCPVRVPQKPLRMILLQYRSPARVVDHDVQDNAATPQVRLIGQFPELVHPRRALVEDHQRRVNRFQVQRRIRAAVLPKPRVSRRGGVDGQQMQNPAAQCPENVWKLALQIPKRP